MLPLRRHRAPSEVPAVDVLAVQGLRRTAAGMTPKTLSPNGQPERTATELTPDEAIRRLVTGQETHDPCENGHVEHTAADHLGRRLVHSRSPNGFGANWDVADAEAFIRKATRIVDLESGDHPIAVFSDDGHGPRWIKFEARPA